MLLYIVIGAVGGFLLLVFATVCCICNKNGKLRRNKVRCKFALELTEIFCPINLREFKVYNHKSLHL